MKPRGLRGEGEGSRAAARRSPARCSHWVSPAAVRSGPPGGSQKCRAEGACEPAARPGCSPRPCRGQRASLQAPARCGRTPPPSAALSGLLRAGAAQHASRVLDRPELGKSQRNVTRSQMASVGDHEGRACLLRKLHSQAPPPGPGSRVHPSPHVNAGGLCGGSQQQFRGAVPARGSTPSGFLQRAWGFLRAGPGDRTATASSGPLLPSALATRTASTAGRRRDSPRVQQRLLCRAGAG